MKIVANGCSQTSWVSGMYTPALSEKAALDSAICAATLNDFACLKNLCPNLQAIAHNGGESFKHAKHTQLLGLPVHKLPSTSPANASWSFERKLAAWREVFNGHGLPDNSGQ